MTELPPTQSAWRWAMLPLWGVFLVMGLYPEQTYLRLRGWGGVVTQNALINSPVLLYMGLVAFLLFFAYQRCREHGLDEIQARARTFAILVYGLLGFFPVRLESVFEYARIPIPGYRHLLLATCALKLLCWGYLAVLLLRYHFVQGTAAFANLPVLFPSAADRQEETADDDSHPS